MTKLVLVNQKAHHKKSTKMCKRKQVHCQWIRSTALYFYCSVLLINVKSRTPSLITHCT